MKAASILILCAALFAATPLAARADDASDIQATIRAQLQAFNAGDGATAYSYAAPNIKALFPSPDIFMTMVKSGYAPVYHSHNAVFGALTPEGDGFRQEVRLTGDQGHSWIASYTLARQSDGSMKITSCTLRKGDDVAV
ncbi:DUF4864 domain-containing protein [Jiella sp. MQZ9-1]|uniref:DUF4864 domain-containing protein n=1 Tax=Jiella flava TaxID=2816857 RepID=A0A939JWD5_9HYPH|nr:DUF4864 domain-containing protein [Jiella flava]MBO0662932.1 DUF4864 domain-containing protein [Jiella flava]MCD2471308.1 DUF4864 domain-containing protein [Jiella flava]